LIQQASAGGQSATQIVNAINQIQQNYSQIAGLLPAGANPFTANQTSLTLKGAAITELSAGYGGAVPFVGELPLVKRLSVGANVKWIRADVSYASVNILNDNSDMSDLLKDFNNNRRTSYAPGLDLGALYDMKDTFLKSRGGLVIRNINRPSFDQPVEAEAAGVSKYKLDSQVRAGWAYYPWNWLVVAADLDLTRNLTSLPGYKSREAGLGAEINLVNKPWLNFALRGGLMKNVGETGSPLAYTGGLGLNLFHFYLELGGAVSSKTVKIQDGTKIPSSARVALNLGVRF
jgi:hypothetical protein